MRTLTSYRIRQLGKLLASGKAWIEGQTCDGHYWPEGNHYWIVQDGTTHTTYHVAVGTRPMWAKYDTLKED